MSNTPILTAHLNAMNARDGRGRALALNFVSILMAVEHMAELADSEHPALDHLKDWNAYICAKSADIREQLVAMADALEASQSRNS